MKYQQSLKRCSGLAFAATLASVLLSASPTVTAADPVYLTQPWFDRGPDLNLLKTASGSWLSVDNDGQLLVDQSIIPGQHQRFRFDTITECFGDYYMALNLGNHGFDWHRISEGNKFLTKEELLAKSGLVCTRVASVSRLCTLL